MRRGTRILLALLLSALFMPASARAHVTLRKSEPGANAILTGPPLLLKFWFTEPVELAITKISIVDAAGKNIALTTPEPVAAGSDEGVVQVKLFATLGAGTYRVTWATVALDGHVAKGTYTFRVLGETESVDTAFAAAAARAQRDSAIVVKKAEEAAKPVDILSMRSATPGYVVTRTISFSALLLLIGSSFFWLLVIRPTEEADPATWKRISSRLALLGAGSALVYVCAAFVRLYLQTQLVSGNDDPTLGDFSSLLYRTNWGVYWRVQVYGALTMIFLWLISRLLKRATWYLTAATALVVAFGTSSVSHAGAAEVMRTFGVLNDAAHLVAISTWLGGLFWLITVALPLFSSADRRSKRVVSLVNGFSRVALASTAIVLFTGVVSARFRVGTIHGLVASTYGQVLIIKLLLVAGVASFGFYNWRTVRPSLSDENAADVLKKTARGELAVAFLVLATTAVLVALPLPKG